MVKVDHGLIVGGSSWVVKVAHGGAWWIIVEYNGSDVEQGGSWWSMVDHTGSWWCLRGVGCHKAPRDVTASDRRQGDDAAVGHD